MQMTKNHLYRQGGKKQALTDGAVRQWHGSKRRPTQTVWIQASQMYRLLYGKFLRHQSGQCGILQGIGRAVKQYFDNRRSTNGIRSYYA